jgi:hypothetical protein
VPGMLNPRQYQGLAQVWNSPSTTFAAEVYNPTAKDQQAATMLIDTSDDIALLFSGEEVVRHTEGQAAGLEVWDTGVKALQPTQSLQYSTGTSIASQPALAVRLSPVKPRKTAPTASQLEEASYHRFIQSGLDLAAGLHGGTGHRVGLQITKRLVFVFSSI